jgi:hypothetical protein
MNDEPAPKTQATDTKSPDPSVSPTWRWRTFPVFAAFVSGLLIASLLNRETDSAIEGAVQIAALAGASYVLIHLFVMKVLVAGRIRRRTERTLRAEEPAELFEDVAVYDAQEDE